VLFVEIPTNPDMKVPDMARLAQLLTAYQKQSNKRVLLLVDTTFAPASQVMKLMSDVAPELTTMVFLSMSKSVSRGYTTAGALVANTASQESCALLQTARDAARVFDTVAKKDQMFRLATNHVGVEDRCQRAYHVAAQVGSALVEVVGQVSNGYEMELAFPTPAQAALGFSSSTFSFNLPPQKDATFEQNEALAQKYVDLLTEHKSFKPCVSFGQDNGLVYCTVPATSTQGAIKAEDKAKQAVGGVQLTRLSFPPVDGEALTTITQHVVNSIKKLYA
jgi:cysteine synthase A